MIEIRGHLGGRISEPGAYRLDPVLYHSDPCPEPSLSNSIAKLLIKGSPLHAWTAHPRLNRQWKPDDESNRLAIGSACHKLFLGQGREIIVVPYDDYRKKLAQEIRDAAYAEGKIPLTVPQNEQALQIHERLPLAVTGDAEVVVCARSIGGGWKRSMFDLWSKDRTTVYEYKTVQALGAQRHRLARHMAQMGYDFQEAFYRQVLEDAFPELAGRVRFIFIAQEIEPPYSATVAQISAADIAVALRQVHAATAIFHACLINNDWPGYPTGIQRIEMPAWHQREWLEQELEGEV